MPVTVLLADSTEVVLRSIRGFLADSPDIELVGIANDFAQAIHLANGLRPQIIVMDLHMTHGSPHEVKARLPLRSSRLLAMSLSSDADTKVLAENCGASILLDKMKLADELVPAIKKLALPIARSASAK